MLRGRNLLGAEESLWRISRAFLWQLIIINKLCENIGMNYTSDSQLLEIITRYGNDTCILNVSSMLFVWWLNFGVTCLIQTKV